jgi:hypothetical protein
MELVHLHMTDAATQHQNWQCHFLELALCYLASVCEHTVPKLTICHSDRCTHIFLLPALYFSVLMHLRRKARTKKIVFQICVVLETGPGNRPGVRIWTRITVQFGSRPVQQPDSQLLHGPNSYLYLWTYSLCHVCLDPSVPISGAVFVVIRCMIAVRYVTVICKILSLVHYSLYLLHWLHL